MNPGGGSGWDEPPLDIQVPDDARELQRDVLAYHRELRAQRRRTRLRRLAGPFAPFAARGSVMPLLASILAVCLVAGAMLSVATFSPATAPADRTPRPTTASLDPPSPRHGPDRPRPARRGPLRCQRRPGPAFRDPAPRSQRQPLDEPVGLVDPAEPVRTLGWLGLTRCPALSPAGGTATIAFRPTGVNRGGALP